MLLNRNRSQHTRYFRLPGPCPQSLKLEEDASFFFHFLRYFQCLHHNFTCVISKFLQGCCIAYFKYLCMNSMVLQALFCKIACNHELITWCSISCCRLKGVTSNAFEQKSSKSISLFLTNMVGTQVYMQELFQDNHACNNKKAKMQCRPDALKLYYCKHIIYFLKIGNELVFNMLITSIQIHSSIRIFLKQEVNNRSIILLHQCIPSRNGSRK